MNCQNFLERMNDVARGSLMDATARAEALAHQAACGVCAARLTDDRTLSAGLRALAERDAALEAPPRVEAALLAAFRARHAAPAVARKRNVADSSPETVTAAHAEARATDANAASLSNAGTRPNVASLEDARALRRWTWRQSLATAATAAAAAVAFMMIIGPFDAPPKLGGSTIAETTRPAAGAQTLAEIDSTSAVAGDMREATEKREESGIGAGVVRGELAVLPSKRETSTAGRSVPAGRAAMMPAKYERGGRTDGIRGGAAVAAEASGDEYATDFIPLYQAEQAGPVVTGQLVRVELPRSALSRFGLPVSSEGGGERVKADVLLGEDGMARAIRFVR